MHVLDWPAETTGRGVTYAIIRAVKQEWVIVLLIILEGFGILFQWCLVHKIKLGKSWSWIFVSVSCLSNRSFADEASTAPSTDVISDHSSLLVSIGLLPVLLPWWFIFLLLCCCYDVCCVVVAILQTCFFFNLKLKFCSHVPYLPTYGRFSLDEP
jgi:hypothetical protein